MPTLLQINVNRNVGSTGRIAEGIGSLAIAHGWQSYIAHGRMAIQSESHEIRIGSGFHVYMHGLQTRLFDRHGLGSAQATKELVKVIQQIKPDIIHLHNIHGYYLNIGVLFDFLSKASIPVVWTLHDSWLFTGHCAYFDFVGCDKWKTECNHCPQKGEYPKSLLFDRSTQNFHLKKTLFTSLSNLVLVPVSDWHSNLVKDSFLKTIPKQTIHNGIDTSLFKPQENGSETRLKYGIGDRMMLLGVASPWSQRKGLTDFIRLSKRLNQDEVIVLVGLDYFQIKDLPANIIGLPKTNNTQELVDLYSAADLFINPTWEDNFPTTNLESLACGTPVVTYKTGGSVESISPETGFVVEQGDLDGLINVIETVRKDGKLFYSEACRISAVKYFNKDICFEEYIDLYEKILNNSHLFAHSPLLPPAHSPSPEKKIRNSEDKKFSETDLSKGKKIRGLEDEKFNLSTSQPLNLSTSQPLNLSTSQPLNLSTSQPLNRPKTQIMPAKKKYQICTNCIMDTSDPKITFDERGWCDYCRNYHKNIAPNWHPNEQGMKELQPLLDQIKKEGKGKSHDCLIGLSGGIDSSYVAYLAKEKFGLRPMLFHVDAGWNSQEAVNNIEKLVDGLGLDLYTEVINWEEMKDLQLAFFKAQVPHIDTPQDHAFFAGLYNFAAKHQQKYIFTGANYSTECVREPVEWHYHASDLAQLKDIHRKFGTRPLKTFPTADIFTYKLYYRFFKGVQVVKPLNHVRYIKEEAMDELVEKFGWQKYLHKHYESRFTRFYEGYWLPTKFGYQKHRAHYSSLILTGQMTREHALDCISRPAYDAETIARDFEYIAKKLEITVPDLQALMDGENKSYRDYKNNLALIDLGIQVSRLLGIQKAIIR